MNEPETPMAAFVSHLLSRGLLGQDLTEAIRLAEAAFAVARSSGSDEARRLNDRLRKQDYRSRKAKMSPGQNAEGLSSNHTDSLLEQLEEQTGVPNVPGTTDDWPTDFLEQFWKAFPPFRRQAKAKVADKLARIRAQTGKKKVTWATLINGVVKFAATNPGQYAPAPMVWLNDGRWDREYGGSNAQANGTGTGKTGFSGIAARLRQQQSNGELPDGQPPEGPRR